MKGHAFDAYTGAQALVEGNVFAGVSQPVTDKGAGVSTFVVNAGSACSSALGRSCLENSVDSASGKLSGGSSTSFIKSITNDVTPLEVSKVAAHVKANAGPANLGSASAEKDVDAPTSTKAATTTKAAATSKAVATTKAATSAAVIKTTLATVKKPAATQTAASSGAAIAAWGQCGGQGYTGSTTCASGLACKKQNDWYSQCL